VMMGSSSVFSGVAVNISLLISTTASLLEFSPFGLDAK
jgi:hypothetical protein